MTKFLTAIRGLVVLPERRPGRYFHCVDLIRGLAALAILVWHYPHFYFNTKLGVVVYDPKSQPFYDALELFYRHGYFAVQLFWLISGFVFASVYAGTAPSGREFFVNRFARLYPLHFATLILVALLQLLSYQLEGAHQIYEHNDAEHFLLNLLFISHWGFEAGDSFNAPIWSVSVEIFVYIVFFLSLRFLFTLGIIGPILMAALFALLFAVDIPGAFWQCGTYFFAGCGVYIWLIKFRERNFASALAGVLAMVGGVLLLRWNAPHTDDAGRVCLFSGLVLTAASIDFWDKRHTAARFAMVGNMTYSLYLLHVPVQILIILVMNQLRIGRDVVTSPWFFLGFIALMVVLAVLSYRNFELPARHWVRKSLQPKARVALPAMHRQEKREPG